MPVLRYAEACLEPLDHREGAGQLAEFILAPDVWGTIGIARATRSANSTPEGHR
ncbi:MAG: hypothetical protein ACLSAH_20020 [Bilophila wadsworthia]